MHKVLFTLTSVFLLSILVSCGQDTSKEFHLPKRTHLSDYGFFNPIFVEFLLDPPLKYGDIWNDSLLKVSKVKRMEFIHKGNISPEQEAERIEYNFHSNGKQTTFNFYNYELSPTVFTSVIFDYSNTKQTLVKAPKFFGQASDAMILIKNEDKRINLLKSKSKGKFDSTFIYREGKNVRAIIEKIDNYVSSIYFFQDVSSPTTLSQNFAKQLGISPHDLIFADKSITFLKQGRPEKCYQINEEFVKDQLLAEWQYTNKRLDKYKKYVNGNCVKEFSFNYSEDKLLRSMTFNNKLYEILYN